jgi:hypothetical protein
MNWAIEATNYKQIVWCRPQRQHKEADAIHIFKRGPVLPPAGPPRQERLLYLVTESSFQGDELLLRLLDEDSVGETRHSVSLTGNEHVSRPAYVMQPSFDAPQLISVTVCQCRSFGRLGDM